MGRSRDLADGTLAELNVDSNTLAVDATNNRVGIGTNSPSAPLHIQKTGADAGILIEETSITGYSQYLQLKDSTTSWYVVNRYASGGAGNSGFGIGTTTSGDYLQIDTSGRVTMPYQPYFVAYKNSSTWESYSSQVVVWDSTQFNVGNHFNTSTGVFTAPIAGLYSFNAQIYQMNGLSYGYTSILVNGSSDSRMRMSLVGDNYSSPDTTNNLTVVWKLSANDTVSVLVNGDLFTGHSRFSGYLVS